MLVDTDVDVLVADDVADDMLVDDVVTVLSDTVERVDELVVEAWEGVALPGLSETIG